MIILSSAQGSVTIRRNPGMESYWSHGCTQSNQTMAKDGSHLGCHVGRKYITGSVKIKFVSEQEASDISFFLFAIQFGKFPFSITTTSGADFGRGETVDNCFWNGEPSTENYIVPSRSKLNYEIEIPYITFDPAMTQGIGTRR